MAPHPFYILAQGMTEFAAPAPFLEGIGRRGLYLFGGVE
jgi:hypothetical protein